MIVKIKQIIRIIFPKKISVLEKFEYDLKTNHLVKSFQKTNQIYEVILKNDKKIFIRDNKYSDYEVFNQIFKFKEYEIIKNMLLNNNSKNNQKIIIDAGANVGYTTVYFSNELKDIKIFAIEPSSENCEMIFKNSSFFKNIKVYQMALSEKENTYFNLDRNFRDGKDWSIATAEAENGDIKGISIKEIINENGLEHISLLKIDIEGAERFIFKKDNNLDFLKITEIVALEIHDEFDIRNSINEILTENGFFIFESGELTIGINSKLR